MEILLLPSMGSFAFTPPSQVYNHQSLPQPTTEYITLSLLGHWLLPIFTPQLCMTPHDTERLMFDTNLAVTF